MESNNMKIRVGIPSYAGKLFPETWETVKALSAYEGPLPVRFDVLIVPQCYTVSEGRNKAAAPNIYRKKHIPDYDYYLSMDADMSFPVAAVFMLIDDKRDIVSAAYNMRSATLNCLTDKIVAARWTVAPGLAPESAYLPETVRGIQKVDTVGLGCCLIKSSVFATMEYPYFRHNVVDFDNGNSAILAPDDVSFGVNAARYGFDIFVDADVRVNHHHGNENR
jgi:hypothetical protein